MKTAYALIAAFWFAGLGTPAGVQAQDSYEYKIDPVHSSVLFKVRHRNLSDIYGRFGKISGTITLDQKKNPSKLEINAEVDVRTLDTNERKRDRHLKSEDFFHISKFRTAKFETQEVEKVGDNKFRLTGDMTLLGTTKPVSVEFEITGERGGGNSHRIGGRTTFTVKRSDFGMSFMIPDISDEVTVIVSVQAEHKTAPAG